MLDGVSLQRYALLPEKLIEHLVDISLGFKITMGILYVNNCLAGLALEL